MEKFEALADDQGNPVELGPLVGVLRETPGDEGVEDAENGGVAVVLELLGGEVPVAEVLLHGCVEEGGVLGDVEGVAGVEHLVEDDSDGEDVALAGEVRVGREEFGTAVGEGEAGTVRWVGREVRAWQTSGW